MGGPKCKIKEISVDTKVLLGHRRSVSTFVLVFAFIGLFVLCSACTSETRAASEPQNKQGADTLLVGDPLAHATQDGTILHFVPSPQQVTVGGVVAVQLRLENVQNLYGIEVHLAFDKNIVQIKDDGPSQDGDQVTVGDIPYPDFPIQNMVDNYGGRLDYAVVQLAPRPAANGSGVVATIHFLGVREGTSPIHFTSAKLASPDGFPIAATFHDGTIVVGETTGPTATPQPPTPTQAPGDTPAPPAPTATPAIVSTPTPAACPTLYVVRSGDTAFAIARRFGISLDILAEVNALSASFEIKISQLLIIPGVPGPTGKVHTVQAGETLYSLAGHYGTSVETLAAINGIPHPWHVGLGESLLICPP